MVFSQVKKVSIALMIAFFGLGYNFVEACQQASHPQVNIAVLLIQDGKLLLGLYQDAHGVGTWAPPFGCLEYGEPLENCAYRLALDQTGTLLNSVSFYALTNDIFEDLSKHDITIFMTSTTFEHDSNDYQSDDYIDWQWFDLNSLPRNIYVPLQHLIQLHQ
ncbi:MAG: nucleotide triphosphate diphosphatase NUDT15 [Candidatus Chromulinivorax sp.]